TQTRHMRFSVEDLAGIDFTVPLAPEHSWDRAGLSDARLYRDRPCRARHGRSTGSLARPQPGSDRFYGEDCHQGGMRGVEPSRGGLTVIRAARNAWLVVAFSLLATVAPADADDPW